MAIESAKLPELWHKLLKSPVLRLSLVYWAIIMVLTIGFSGIIYSSASRELDRELRHPTTAESVLFVRSFDFDNFRDNRLQDSQNRLRNDLILLNIVTLILAGGISYYAARRTIRPIQTALDAQARFASDASHELRTPLAAMRAEIEVALRDPNIKKSELQEILESNLEETNRLQELTESLLLLARQSDGPISQTEVDIKTIASKAADRLAKMASQRQINLHQQVKSAKLMGNQSALTEMIFVLLDNAVKFSPDQAVVTIKGRRQANYYQLSVTDQGPGIAADQQAHIFDRFYQADKSRSHQGFGLGLSIAAAIVKQHHGRIKVTSQPGQGASFTIDLPLLMTDDTVATAAKPTPAA